MYPKHVATKSDQKIHDHFWAFLFAIWKHLKLPPPTYIQRDMADYLQHGPRRRIIQAFRGCGKSWITAAYVLWLLYRDPQHKIMVVSASKERADAFSIFCKRLISDMPLLKFLEPREDQRSSNIAFDVAPADPDQSPSVKSVGITGQLTGSRADTIVADDVEIPKNSFTELQREKLGELVKEFDAILKPGGQVVYLGTPQVAQSLYSQENLQGRGYECRIWPARFTYGLNEQGGDAYNDNLAPKLLEDLQADPTLVGHTTEPTRFTDIDLAEREASYGRSGFALQFMLDTSLNDANRYPLKISDLIIFDCDSKIAPVQMTWASGPLQEIEGLTNVGLNGDRYHRPMYVAQDYLEYQASVMFIDPSGRGADETAYCVAKMLNGFIYILRWGGLPGGYDDATLTALCEIAKAEAVNKVVPEDNFGDGMFTALLKPHLARIYPTSILEEYRVTGQKELRIIDKLEPVMNQHRLVLNKAIIENDIKVNPEVGHNHNSGLYQMTHLTKDRQSLKHDDRIDVLAEAVGYFTDMVQNDAQKAEEKHKDKMQDRELQKFMDTIKGKTRNRKKVYASDGSIRFGGFN